jgi:putative membrane protein
MARHAIAYLIVGSLAASLLQCSKDKAKEPETPPAPMPQATAAEPSMMPAAGTTPTATAAFPPAPAESEQQQAAAAAAQSMTDEQIASVTDAANTAEIEQAKVAKKNAKNARVKKFAAMVSTDHTEAKEKQKKLLVKIAVIPTQSSMAAELESGSKQKLEEIKSLKGAEFDRAYIDGQVQVHQKLLDALDQQLIPGAKNDEFKALLGDMRAKIAAHLEEAKEIQQMLADAASSPSTGQSKGGSPSGSKATTPEQSGNKPTAPEQSGKKPAPEQSGRKY